MGLMGTAKRLATAIDREYVLRNKTKPIHEYITFECKTCGKEFRRGTWGHQSKDYCSKTCFPSTKRYGEDTSDAKLTWMQVDEIRNLKASGGKITHEAIAKRYRVSRSAVGEIINYKTWKPEHDPRRQPQDAGKA